MLVVLVACSGKNSLPALSEQSLPLMSSDSNKAKESETITDHRDGQIYKTVKIGNQVWMAENLNYETENSYCYDDRMSNCLKYGRLYKWTVALDACPAGWHLPDSAEWKTLIDTLGGATASALPLKSHTGWFYDWSHFGNGTDSSHFSGFPAGMRNGEDDSVFLAMGKSAYFWSSTDILPSYANGVRLHDSVSFDGSHKKNAYSIRCVKDFVRREGNDERRENNAVIPDLIGNLLDPRDGQSYRTVTIGNQTWMAQNLNYETKNSSCFNDQVVNCAKIGSLYTWEDAMNVCPAGYHLPDLSEWRTLFATVGGQTKAGKSLKSQTGWFAGGNGTDSYGFAALPAGDKDFMGSYGISDKYAYFWSSTEVDSNKVYYVNLRSGKDNAYMLDDFKHGRQISVRCIKDRQETKDERRENNAVIPDLIGNLLDPRDGQSYRTVTIGNQTWMAQNLNYETKNSSCFNDQVVNCAKIGSLYTWEDAMNVCPAGYHLPDLSEWRTLFATVGGQTKAGKSLKSQTGWFAGGNGTDSYGFAALPAGDKDFMGSYGISDKYAYFWSSTEVDSNKVYYVNLRSGKDNAYMLDDFKHGRQISVRCIKDRQETKDERRENNAVIPDLIGNLLDPRDGSRMNDSIVSLSSWSNAIGSITDPRDGQSYTDATAPVPR